MMQDKNGYESRLWKVLEKEQLADLSQFHKARFFDEVPLYSRYADVAFLPSSVAKANAVLLGFSLKLLNAVISYEMHHAPFFAAVTVWSDPEEEVIVPNLFVWSGPTTRLKHKLRLARPGTSFGKQLEHHISRLRLAQRFSVREDTTTAPGLSRIFIAPAQRRYPGLVTLDDFPKTGRAGKRQRA